MIATDFETSVSPNPIFVGETGKFKITSTIGQPSIISFPKIDGIQWIKNSPSTSVQIMNRNRTDSVAYLFNALKPGTYIIPAIKVQIANRVLATKPTNITIKNRLFSDNKETLTIDELIFLKIKYDNSEIPPTKIYLGQDIKLTIELYVDERLKIHTDKFDQTRSFTNPTNYFPTLNLNNVVFQDYSKQNPYNSKFLYDDNKSTIENNRRYQVFRYYTNIAGVEPGTIGGTVEHSVPVIDPNNQNDRSRNRRREDFFNTDDFFGFSGFSRRKKLISHTAKKEIDPIEIISIPSEKSEEGNYLGLIGQWKIRLELDREEVDVGEDVTLLLTAMGSGNVANLRVPELELQGFRIYPPEITREVQDNSVGKIKWVIIPLNSHTSFPQLKFSTFNANKGEFELFQFQPSLTVKATESRLESGPLVEDYGQGEELSTIKERSINRATDILYIKTELNNYITLPLWTHAKSKITILFIGGPAFFICILFIVTRREKFLGSDVVRRRNEARKNRSRVFQKVKQATPEDLPSIIRSELVPFLIAIFNLPPGSTLSELTKKVDDKELVEILKQAEIGGYMPGKTATIQSKVLLAKVKELLIFVFCCILPSICLGTGSFEDAAKLYDDGRLDEAKQIYESLNRVGAGNSGILFNLGNCAYRKAEYGHAIVYYEKARRLAPRDSEIRENLNFVRSQLNLPPIPSNDHPMEIIRWSRDHLRPDEWLIGAGIVWLSFWLLLAFSRVQRKNYPIVQFLLVLLFVVANWAFFAQKQSTYSPHQGVIIAQDAPLYRLPQEGDEKNAKSVLNSGEFVTLAEKRANWSRIRIDQNEGWVKNSAVEVIW